METGEVEANGKDAPESELVQPNLDHETISFL